MGKLQSTGLYIRSVALRKSATRYECQLALRQPGARTSTGAHVAKAGHRRHANLRAQASAMHGLNVFQRLAVPGEAHPPSIAVAGNGHRNVAAGSPGTLAMTRSTTCPARRSNPRQSPVFASSPTACAARAIQVTGRGENAASKLSLPRSASVAGGLALVHDSVAIGEGWHATSHRPRSLLWRDLALSKGVAPLRLARRVRTGRV